MTPSAPPPPVAPPVAAPPRRTSSASGAWDVAPARRSGSASGAWEEAPSPRAATAPDDIARPRAAVPFGASGAWDLASRVTPAPTFRGDELPPVPRTDETLPLWQAVYDEMRPAFERQRRAYQGWDTGRWGKDIDPEAIRERAWMAQVDREYRRRYWAGR